jgi:hypothetical protein
MLNSYKYKIKSTVLPLYHTQATIILLLQLMYTYQSVYKFMTHIHNNRCASQHNRVQKTYFKSVRFFN